ncbi:hypothetical protein B0H16DRAFT_1493816 [Mycena metata]|uniref:Uncharacterized protein n=1 Tax=Mycena metata TaxID=1033252 RepID=A0AAD7NZW0_9AGAR|nr:hypothetical protein B0H16DRAFT_1493816 [Mycena metata]
MSSTPSRSPRPLPAYPQTKFPIFRCDDPVSPRRFANAAEVIILRQILAQTRLLLDVPRVREAFALALKTDILTPLDLEVAERVLQVMPQLELTEGLLQEAIVVRSADYNPNQPTSSSRIRIQLRAERLAYIMYLVDLEKNDVNAANLRRQIAFISWTLLHECMHLSREFAFLTAQEKTSPPRLRYGNKFMADIWMPPPSSSPSSELSSAPCKDDRAKGESGYWLEARLTGGCSLEAVDTHIDGTNLMGITTVLAAKKLPQSQYYTWKISDAFTGIKILDDVATATTVAHMEIVIDAIHHRISTVPPTRLTTATTGSAKAGWQGPIIDDKDVYDAHEGETNPMVKAYLVARGAYTSPSLTNASAPPPPQHQI